MKVVAVLWPDNTLDVVDDASELFDRVSLEQMSHCTRDSVKLLLAERARVWSGAQVNPGLEDEQFLDELDRIGFVLVERFDA